MRASGAFAPLAERNFAWYFSSRLVNTLGAMMANIALTFAVLDIDGRAVAIGYDFLFVEPDRQAPAEFVTAYPTELSPAAAAEVAALPSMDGIFARVIGRAPVVLARSGVDASSYDSAAGAVRDRSPPLAPVVAFEGPAPESIPY